MKTKPRASGGMEPVSRNTVVLIMLLAFITFFFGIFAMGFNNQGDIQMAKTFFGIGVLLDILIAVPWIISLIIKGEQKRLELKAKKKRQLAELTTT